MASYALQYHQLMPISCHFGGCKALLVLSLQRYSKYPVFMPNTHRRRDAIVELSRVGRVYWALPFTFHV